MLKQKAVSNDVEVALTSSTVSGEAVTDDSVFESLGTSLAEIRKLKGVMGYILRSSSSAVVDVDESDKVIPYAMLGSQTLESCQEIARLFCMGETESMLVESSNVKMLCMKFGQNTVNVFMETGAAHAAIIKKLQL